MQLYLFVQLRQIMADCKTMTIVEKYLQYLLAHSNKCSPSYCHNFSFDASIPKQCIYSVEVFYNRLINDLCFYQWFMCLTILTYSQYVDFATDFFLVNILQRDFIKLRKATVFRMTCHFSTSYEMGEIYPLRLLSRIKRFLYSPKIEQAI